ncbi:Tc toxin subunit A-related protein [Leptodesmis sichuanensis]|uniref:Tc toxin subunit A-related protein n=1 Tax=Leptodesmis sichuanensis TaxID=2906798 RepID=UPI001F3E9A03|nr:hypothetical protein [Leptodesmis sichuanensis]UIE37912.1 hypothetical protein KIK02_23890 [Leptodesmis sichuanensis A121]
MHKADEVIQTKYDYYNSREFMNPAEWTHISLIGAAALLQAIGEINELTAFLSHTVPDFTLGTSGAYASPVFVSKYGGSNVARSSKAFADATKTAASILNTAASMSLTIGNYQRREEEWKFQTELAFKEHNQIDKQILAAEIRLSIAERDLENHDLQTENANTVDAYMRDKFTNQELYDWMVGQISSLYFQSYQLAYDIAKRAEKAYRYELGIDDSNFIQFGYWDSLKKGLLAGEKLHYDLKRLEMAYLDQNKREYELTKHISLAILDPIALLQLKETGECFVSIPEVLFDLDFPGHYLRRIKAISLTIPCVSGPYTSVSCTLTLQSNRIRKRTTMSADTGYTWTGDFNDDRFNYNLGGIQSIATSSGQNDSGLFELNFRDERYLPFEGAGAISTWHIQLPKDFRQFDYDTISDVVMHMRYTAREGGADLKEKANQAVADLFAESSATVPLIRAFSAKQEFSSEWYQFLHPKATDESHKLDLAITPNRFPFQFRDKTITISKVEVFLKFKDIQDEATYTQATPLGDYTAGNAPLGLYLVQPDSSTPQGPENLNCDSLFQGIPHAIFAEGIDREVKASDSWSIEARDAEVGAIASTLRTSVDGHKRLKAEAIDDLLIVCHYSVQV